MTSVTIDPELTREVFEAAQAVRLLKVICRGTECPVQLFYSEEREPERAWLVAVSGHMFSGATLLQALEAANPLLQALHG